MRTQTIVEFYSEKCNELRRELIAAENRGDFNSARYFKSNLLRTIKKYRVASGMRKVA